MACQLLATGHGATSPRHGPCSHHGNPQAHSGDGGCSTHWTSAAHRNRGAQQNWGPSYINEPSPTPPLQPTPAPASHCKATPTCAANCSFTTLGPLSAFWRRLGAQRGPRALGPYPRQRNAWAPSPRASGGPNDGRTVASGHDATSPRYALRFSPGRARRPSRGMRLRCPLDLSCPPNGQSPADLAGPQRPRANPHAILTRSRWVATLGDVCPQSP